MVVQTRFPTLKSKFTTSLTPPDKGWNREPLPEIAGDTAFGTIIPSEQFTSTMIYFNIYVF